MRNPDNIKHALEAIGAGLAAMMPRLEKLGAEAQLQDCASDAAYELYQLKQTIKNQIHIADCLKSGNWDADRPGCEGCGEIIPMEAAYLTSEDGIHVCTACAGPEHSRTAGADNFGVCARHIDLARAVLAKLDADATAREAGEAA